MHLPNYRYLYLIATIALIARIAVGILFIDAEKANWNEYGEIAENIINGKGHSFYYLEDNKLAFEYSESANPLPSAYMPPGYTLLILPALLPKNIQFRYIVLLLINSIMAFFVVILLYHFTYYKFGLNSAIIAAWVYALLPEFIYASTRVVPTVAFHLLVIWILYELYMGRNIWLLAIILAVSVYFRSEMLLFVIALSGIFAYRRELKKAILILSVTAILLSPWVIRNYIVFEELVLTTNSGINFFRGFNEHYPGYWGDTVMYNEIADLAISDQFEIEMNKYYFTKAKNAIINKPEILATYTVEKIASFFLIDFRDIRSFNLFFLIPWIAFAVFAYWGFYLAFDIRQHKYDYLFILIALVSSLIFFSQARYQTQIKIVLLPFLGYALSIVWDKIQRKKSNAGTL